MKNLVNVGILITFISIFSWAKANLIDECPLPEDNYPCYCEEDDGPTVMHCNYLNKSEQIKEAMNKLAEYKIYKVSMFKNEIPLIKSDAFKGPSVSQIIFSNSTVSFESPAFVGMESSLTRITFLACFDEKNAMRSWSFSHLGSLRDVTFDRNTIRTLTNNWLSSTGPSLRSITFTECSIEKLEDKVFQKVENLATLFLSDNKISSVTRSMFPRPAENLRAISLNNNKLEDLPDDIFEDMPSLNSLELQKNLLKTLSESAWSSVIESLSRVHLDDNPFRCDKNMKWISKKFLPKTFTGTCNYPSKLKNKSLRTLTPADFH